MSRLKARAAKRRKQTQDAEQAGFWPELCRRIDAGQVIPIISNSVFDEQVFFFDDEDEFPKSWNIEERLTDVWSAEVGYPLSEQHWLPRVALFDRVVNSTDDRASKVRYLNWLKETLLFLAEGDDEIDPDTIEELRDDIEQQTFSDIAIELGYPRSANEKNNQLQQLAELKLPIYITTSPFDFLERAIKANRRNPRTQICFWSEEPATYLDESHKMDYDFKPTVENPLVFHVFGLEEYPESMVLNEDDYLDFLAIISKDVQQKSPLIPVYLRKAITKSSLILLGYRLRDWDFRVMFRGLINSTPSSLRRFNLSIQLEPPQETPTVSARQIRSYLEKYFGDSDFTVEWNTPEGFVATLWEEWNRWRQ